MKRKEFIKRMDWVVDKICKDNDCHTCTELNAVFYPRHLAISGDYRQFMEVGKGEQPYWLNERVGNCYLNETQNKTLAPLRVDMLTLFKHYALDEELYLNY